ncbi:MAG TPA: tetratricopeptide repeat protein, partial [Candidatus Kapabacteria bacterium]|nr:tetratricopeptide repeat protein [Candidatus Kapabacteria bacterium]
MKGFDNFDAFGFEGEEFDGDSKETRERRRKYFEEELKRHREEKRRNLSTGDGARTGTSEQQQAGTPAPHDDAEEPRFLHPEILEELVDYCIENAKFEEALDFALLLTERAPFNGDGWHRRGMLEAHHGDFEKAIESYEHALAMNPADSELLINYGVALDGAGRTEEALEIFERALSSNPSNDEALFNKGICFEKAERYEDAIAIFRYLREVKEFAKDA